jgi:tetratricopeptide (TPR) repeat protein
MASLIPGYEYDIFISYRQKDNKHDGWVTEFVNNLKGELESTFKEEISVYFDINPHDGLLETHDVDASLKEKLKCLIFIPIISRTYCDPNSFAWDHEFKAFIEQASQDQFGLKVKLPNGNVASRVLPVRIHDLDIADIKECESVLGSVLRGVEFIFKSPGVNRPLRSEEDNPNDNLNHTIYRDQINKVALAIKDIIIGLMTEPSDELIEKVRQKKTIDEVIGEEKISKHAKPLKLTKQNVIYGVLITAILIITAIFVYPKIFKRNTLENLRSTGEKISIAVMPFQNMTNDTIWNIWQDGIQNELINALSNSEELKVRQTESVNGLIRSKSLPDYTSITPSLASSFSEKLNANVLICGSIKQAGVLLRVNTQLIDPKTEEVLKSFQIEGPSSEEALFPIIDSLSLQVKDYLIITKLKQTSSIRSRLGITTDSPEAFRYFIYGNNAFFKKMDYPNAIKLYLQAIAIDSTLYSAITMLSTTYFNQYQYDIAKKWCLKVYENKEQLPLWQNNQVSWLYAMLFETPKEEIKYLNQLLEIDDQNPYIYYELGRIYVALDQYDKAISAMKKTLEIYKKWGSKPRWAQEYIMLGYAFQMTDKYRKENRLFKKAVKDFPDDPDLMYRQAVLALSVGKTNDANNLIENYIYARKINFASEADISSSIGDIYWDADILDKAEENFRKALSFEPENPDRLNYLAYFLIDKNRNINEGLEFADKLVKLSPDNQSYLHTKGWGLFKQGKYREAKDILQKSWDLRRENAVYDHVAFLHLEAAKKAVAGEEMKEGEKR